MTSTNQIGVWAATAWGLIVAVSLTWYLIYSFRRGVITFPARVPSNYSRTVNPGMFWFAAVLYFIFDAFAVVCLLIRAYELLKPAA